MSRTYFSRGAVRRDLQLGEKEVYIFRHHSIVLTAPIATALGALTAAVGASIITDNKPTIVVVWLLSGLLICGQVLTFVDWCLDFFVVTSKRLILSTSPVTNQAMTIELSKVSSINVQRSLAGYLLGYGTLVINARGESKCIANYIKYSGGLYNQLPELIRDAGGKPD